MWDRTEIKDSKIAEFLSLQSENTRRTYSSFFKRILEFSKGESGESMLNNVEGWSRKILALQNWMITQGYSLCTVGATTGMLRGFFAAFKKPLDLSVADKRKLSRVARNSEDYLFTQVDLKKMYDVASLEERYVLLLGSNFGLRATDAIGLTYGKFKGALENAQKENLAAPVPFGTVNTGKENVIAHPFLTGEFVQVVQAFIDTHPDVKDTDRVYINRIGALTATLQNLVFKTKIDVHGQRVRFHSLRKFLYDRLVSVGSDSKAAMIIGHKVKGEIAPYIGADSLRELYERAMPSIVLTNGNGTELKRHVQSLEERNKIMEEENKKLRAEIERMKHEQGIVTSKTATNETQIGVHSSEMEAMKHQIEEMKKTLQELKANK